MKTIELLKEIQKLPVSKRIYLAEKTIQSIREQEVSKQMKRAAEVLQTDYKTDENLRDFLILDCDQFYEAR